MKYFISILVLLSGFSAFAGITISTEGTNASNVVPSISAGSGPNFYYSNISGIPDHVTPPNWAPGNGAAGSCTARSFLINPNCRDATQNFNFSATSTVPTTGHGVMYIRYVPSGSTAPKVNMASGTLISTIGTPVFQLPYSHNSLATAPQLHFGDICAALSADPNLGVNAQCVMTNSKYPVVATLYIIADANGDGYLSPGEDILPFTFTVQSSIPINSSIADQIGFYSFQIFPGDGEAFINQSLPGGTGLFGAYAVKLYYVTGPDVYSSFDPRYFGAINSELTPPGVSISSKELRLNSDGTLMENSVEGLKNDISYYFRAAIVDAAGNTGYLTPAMDDVPANPPRPYQWHAAKPYRLK